MALYRDGLCPLCGRPLTECSPQDGTLPDFVGASRYCHAEVARIEAANASSDPKKADKYAGARLWSTKKRE